MGGPEFVQCNPATSDPGLLLARWQVKGMGIPKSVANLCLEILYGK